MRHYLPQPRWDEKNKRWILRLQIQNRRKAFTSSLPRTQGKNEVREKAQRWLESFDNNSSVTFETAFERFLEDYHIRYGDSQQYRQIWQLGHSHILPKLKKIKCGDIRIEDYQSVINDAKPVPRKTLSGETYYLTDRLSKKSLKNIKGVITSFHKWAVARKYTNLNITDALYLPMEAPVHERKILQLSDIHKIFSEPTGLHYERALMFEILTGVRPGELLGLRIEDYDRDTGIIHIRRSINYKNEVTPGKNRNARRDIALPDRVRQLVEEQIEISKGLYSDWLFCQPSGMHGTQLALNKCWKRICEHHGIAEGTTPYSLRHTFYTHTESFIPDRMVKMIFGHGDKTDSHALYGNHAIDGELKEVANLLEISPIYKTVGV